jgi:hypothetical protein
MRQFSAQTRPPACALVIDQLVKLVRTGLATAIGEGVVAGGKRMEVATLRITARGAGRWRRRRHEFPLRH